MDWINGLIWWININLQQSFKDEVSDITSENGMRKVQGNMNYKYQIYFIVNYVLALYCTYTARYRKRLLEKSSYFLICNLQLFLNAIFHI